MKPRRIAIEALAACRADAIGLHLKRRRTLVLAYHNVVSDAVHDGTLGSQHIRESDFQRQVDWLSRHFDIVPLPEVLNERMGQPSRPQVAITFDDAYRGALQLAIPWLSRRGIPATMFVSPGCLGLDGFWWDRVPVDPWKDFSFFFEQMRGDHERIIAWALAEDIQVRAMDDELCAATEAELAHAVGSSSGHLLLGPHGWRHQNLAALPEEELENELTLPLKWLRDRYPSATIPLLAYPYGLTKPEVCDVAREKSYGAAFLIDGSWMPRRVDCRFMIPRRNVAGGISPATFRMLLAR